MDITIFGTSIPVIFVVIIIIRAIVRTRDEAEIRRIQNLPPKERMKYHKELEERIKNAKDSKFAKIIGLIISSFFLSLLVAALGFLVYLLIAG